jgi:hypothetical protein
VGGPFQPFQTFSFSAMHALVLVQFIDARFQPAPALFKFCQEVFKLFLTRFKQAFHLAEAGHAHAQRFLERVQFGFGAD